MRRFIWRTCVWGALATVCLAESRWVQSRSGPFEIYSDASSRETAETLGVFEQFRYALGQLLGKSDLLLDPPVRILLLKAPAGRPEIVMGRDKLTFVMAPGQPVPPRVFQDCARLLVEQNIGRLPSDFESGLEDFLSTIEIRGTHVTWGAPPVGAARNRNWARVQMLATRPEYYGKLRPLLFNLQKGIAADPAYRNSIGKSEREFEAEVDAYWKAQSFTTADAPSRALSAQRDLPVRPLDAAKGELALADLLNERSQQMYELMIHEKRNIAEANEGLAFLALRRNDEAGARQYLQNATEAGSTNPRLWLESAKREKGARAIEALEKALELDSKSAEAHFLLGERKNDIAELKQATTLAPRNARYWASLAQAYLEQNQFGEAGKAWHAAEQASTDAAEREKMHAAWLSIDQQRLDHEEAEQRRILAEKEQDTQRLKAKALAELRAAEARVNGRPANGTAPGEPQAVVSWWEDGTVQAEGVLKGVECLGKRTRIIIEQDGHALLRLSVKDRTHLSCGAQKPRRVTVHYSPKPNAAFGTAGELASLPE